MFWLMSLCTASYGAEADVAIDHVRIFSPPNTIIEDATLAITGDRISYIGAGVVNIKATRYIDGRNKTIIPGLIDTHVHLFIGADSDAAYDTMIRETAQRKFSDLLSYGVTTVLSVGDYWPQILRVREQVSTGTLLGPRLLISGPMITSENGHPTDIAICTHNPYCREHWAGRVRDAEQAQELVRELAAAKVDLLKVVYDSRERGNTQEKMDSLSPDIIKAIIDEAHAHALLVNVYATPVENAIKAIELGADRLSHGISIAIHMRPDGSVITWPNDTLDKFSTLAKTRGVILCTTLGGGMSFYDRWGVERFAYDGSVYAELSKKLPRAVIDMMLTVNRQNLQDVRIMTERGLTLALGTDAWTLYKPSDGMRQEIRTLLSAGLSPAQVITIATLNAARFVGRERDFGSIETGKLADIVLLSGDPLKNIDALDRVDLVFKEGKVVFDYYQSSQVH
jgi:imidazolonepropionase-like amidohydrolase